MSDRLAVDEFYATLRPSKRIAEGWPLTTLLVLRDLLITYVLGALVQDGALRSYVQVRGRKVDNIVCELPSERGTGDAEGLLAAVEADLENLTPDQFLAKYR